MAIRFIDGRIDGKQLDDETYCSSFYNNHVEQLLCYYCCELEMIAYWPSTVGLKKTKNDKFALKGSGEWDLGISMVEKSRFSKREQFDKLFDTLIFDKEKSLVKAPAKNKITMREVLAKMSITPVNDDVFDQEMIDILGGECSDDEINPETGAKICKLRDFKVTGVQQRLTATAKRGNFYLLINFFYS